MEQSHILASHLIDPPKTYGKEDEFYAEFGKDYFKVFRQIYHWVKKVISSGYSKIKTADLTQQQSKPTEIC